MRLDRLSRQGRLAWFRRAVPDDGRERLCPMARCSVQPTLRSGARRFRASPPGEKVAILSGNDPIAFSCVFGISRAGAVWCPINPRNEAAENRVLLDAVRLPRCCCLPAAMRRLVDADHGPDLPKLATLVCLDGECPSRTSLERWLGEVDRTALAARPGRRSRDDGRHRRNDGPPQGRDADRAQHRDDDRADPDGLSVRGAPGLSGAGAADARRRCSVLPDHGARRRSGDHADQPDIGEFLDRSDAQGHAHIPAADAHLHAAGSSEARKRRS